MVEMLRMMIKCHTMRKADSTYEWTLLVFLIFTLNVDSFKLKCPSQANWKFRAKVKCNSTMKYFCLYNNVDRKYVEGCNGPDWDRKGSKRIFAGYFTREQCLQERFQPIKFWTNESMSDCLYSKSICSEEGQLMLKEDSTKDDRKCRCDYKNSYSYIKTPRNLCSCIPTEEDCSCHIKTCPANYTLSSDYKCIQGSNQEKSKCKDDKFYVAIDDANGVLIERNKTWISGPNFILKFKWRATAKVTILIIICFIFVAVGFFFAALLYHLANEHLLHGLSGSIQRKKGNRSSVDPQDMKGYKEIDKKDTEIYNVAATEKVRMDTVDGKYHVSCDSISDDNDKNVIEKTEIVYAMDVSNHDPFNSTSDHQKHAKPTTEEVYFLRMIHFLFRVACPVVRMIFDIEIQPNQLKKTLDKNKGLLLKLYRKKEKIINNYQWNLLYRSVKDKTVTSEDFDIRLMINLLRTLATNINVGDLYPVSTDTSLGAMLSRINYIRNEAIQSFEGKLTQQQFDNNWNESGQAILKLVSTHSLNFEVDTKMTQLIDRLLELNPMHFDYNKLCSFIDMSEKYPSMILQKIISEYCTDNKLLIEDVLSKAKHDLFHKRIRAEPCCECPPEYSTYINVISEKQWEAFFKSTKRSCLHSCTSDLIKCYERFVPKRIDTSVLSVSMPVILNVPSVLNYFISRLCVDGFSKFLLQNQHTLYHCMEKRRCCKCKNDPIEKVLINKKEWSKLYKKGDHVSCTTTDCCCHFSVINGIEYLSLDDTLLSKIFYVSGPISVLNKIGQDRFLYFLRWTVDDKALRDALVDLLHIIKDNSFSNIAPTISSSNVSEIDGTKTQEDDARNWLHKYRHQKETTETSLQILVRDKARLSIQSAQIPTDFCLPHRPQKFRDISSEENNFLVVVYGLTKIVYPVIRNHFNTQCPADVLDKIRVVIYQQHCNDCNGDNKSQNKRTHLTEKQREHLFLRKHEDSKPFDLELMILLLKQRPEEAKGKKEDDNQLDVIASIRTEIFQSSSGILNKTKFDNTIERMEKAVLHLGGAKYLEDLLNLQHNKNILE